MKMTLGLETLAKIFIIITLLHWLITLQWLSLLYNNQSVVISRYGLVELLRQKFQFIAPVLFDMAIEVLAFMGYVQVMCTTG